MNKRLFVRRLQKILIIVSLVVAGVLFWRAGRLPGLNIFLPNAYFNIPKIPQIEKVDEPIVAPKYFVLTIDSDDPALVANLQKAGWPAFIKNNKIQIGPYLESFKSQLDFSKIRQITPIAVKISDIDFI